MNRSLSLCLPGVFLFSIGCSSPKETRNQSTTITLQPVEISASPSGSPRRDPLASQFVVVTTDPQGAATSDRLDANGSVLQTFPGILLANGGDMWSLRLEKVDVQTSCDLDEEYEDAEPTPPGYATRVALTLAGAEDERVIVDPELCVTDSASTHDVELIAVVGPYLFLDQNYHAEACCGGHSEGGGSFIIWDIARGGPIDVWSDLGSLDDARAAAIEQAGSEGKEDNLNMSALIPRFQSDGSMLIDLRMAVEILGRSPNGETGPSGDWIFVQAPRLPEILKPYRTLPAAVQAFATSHRDRSSVGFTSVTQ